MPRLTFSREYFALLLVEDSCHYLFFSTIFLYVNPFILILLPVVLFAILHAASYSLTLLDVSCNFRYLIVLNLLICGLFNLFVVDILFLATWSKLMVGRTTYDFACGTSNVKYLAIGSSVRNFVDATCYHLCIRVSVKTFSIFFEVFIIFFV